jgi:hypothetical protein
MHPYRRKYKNILLNRNRNISKLSMHRRLFVLVNDILLIKEDAVCKHTVCAHFSGVDPPPSPHLPHCQKFIRIFDCAGSAALQLPVQLNFTLYKEMKP